MSAVRRWLDTIERRLIARMTSYAEGVTVNIGWGRSVERARAHVSGDALAYYRFEGMPLPDIWRETE